MSWCDYIGCGLIIGNIIIHVGTLSLLRQHKNSIRNKNQRNIIAALCGCELSGVLLYGIIYICTLHVSKITLEVMFCFLVMFTKLTYYFIMSLLTMDRFLAFYLNIRYKVYVTSTKLIKLIIGTVTAFLITTIMFSVLVVTRKVTMQRLDNIILPLFLMIDVAYMFLTAGTYVYIFKLYRQHSRMRKINQCTRSKDQFKLLVPSLIIVTFIAFNITPNLLRGAVTYGILSFNEIYFSLSFMFYIIGWLMDPLIYIFNSKCKRNH